MKIQLGHQAITWALGASLALSPVAAQTAWAQQNVGAARIVVNDVKGVVGKNKPAVMRAGIDVFQNEVIRTGDRSASKVVFQDNTNLSIGAGSQVVLDRFVFDPDPAKSQVALSIARGVVRFSTGNLPKSAYQITTPTATIGIRGTILTIVVSADGSTLISVDEGIVLVTSGGQTVTVGAGFSTTVAAAGLGPLPPSPTPPARPPVDLMDTLLAQADRLPAGPPAGRAASALPNSLTIGIFAALAAVGIGLAASSGGGSVVTTTNTIVSPSAT
jgi:hypothetical protein